MKSVLMKDAVLEAQACRRAFSWLSTGRVCQHWEPYFAALPFFPPELIGLLGREVYGPIKFSVPKCSHCGKSDRVVYNGPEMCGHEFHCKRCSAHWVQSM